MGSETSPESCRHGRQMRMDTIPTACRSTVSLDVQALHTTRLHAWQLKRAVSSWNDLRQPRHARAALLSARWFLSKKADE